MFRNSLNDFRLTIVFLLLAFSLNASANLHSKQSQKNSCQIFLTVPFNVPLAVPFGSLRPTFNHNTDYNVELPSIEIKDQCQTGHCHLYTWLAELELKSGIVLSNDYIDVMNIYAKTMKAFSSGQTRIYFGSDPSTSRNSILSFGLIPAEVWATNRKPNSRHVYSKLISGLESILMNAKDQKLSHDDVEEIVFNYIQGVVSPWPDTFLFQGRDFTPKTFREEYFKQLESHYVEAHVIRENDSLQPNSSSPEKSSSNVNSENAVEIEFPKSRLDLEIVEFEDLLMSVLNQGKPVYLSYNHHDQFVDYPSGIMSISAFNYPEEAIATRIIIGTNYNWRGPHAVLVVGYQKDPESGRPIKWKIQNSWGASDGDNGYFHMYSDYFQFHVWGFSYIED